MITALIVDDEMLSIRMMENILDWNSLGIQIVGTAQNGIEALTKFHTLNPNIIITDIQMPDLNGLEFIRKVRESSAQTEFILISAYADFDYVKKAIELGSSNYILKPVDEFELETTLKKITAKISNKKAEEKNAVKNWIGHEKQVLYRYMVNGTNPLAAAKSISNLGIQISSYAIFDFILSDHSINEYTHNNLQLEAQMGFIMERMTSVMNQFGRSLVFDYEDYRWTALLFECEAADLPWCAEKMVAFFSEEIRRDINVCFSHLGRELSELPELYHHLRHLSRFSFFIGDEPVLGYGYNCVEKRFEQMDLLPFSKKLTAALQGGDVEEAGRILDEVLLLSSNADPASLHLFIDFCYNSFCVIREKLISDDKLSEEDHDILNLSYKDISQISTVGEMSQFMNRLLLRFTGDIKAAKPKYSTLVEAGIQYLQSNYDRNLSLEEVCAHLSVSKNYFSYLFKRETGQNLWAYLTDIRLSKSKELLRTTDLKSYEVAYKVGYDNPSYFSKLFKKSTGYTPNEFRGASK